MMPALMQCVFAARAYGLDILDGVYNNFSDMDGFARVDLFTRAFTAERPIVFIPSYSR